MMARSKSMMMSSRSRWSPQAINRAAERKCHSPAPRLRLAGPRRDVRLKERHQELSRHKRRKWQATGIRVSRVPVTCKSGDGYIAALLFFPNYNQNIRIRIVALDGPHGGVPI